MSRPSLLSLLYLPLASAFLTPHSSNNNNNNNNNCKYTTKLRGLAEWREEALDSSYTLNAYRPPNPDTPPQAIGSVPILPFPFNDILLPGQTKELNLYEERYHQLFDEAIADNHSVLAMGLLAGTGMMAIMPLLEIESFTRLGYDPDWVSSGDGMGNGFILVTVRAVGRAKVVDEVDQEGLYMRARVAEVVDVSGMNGVGMVKEKGGSVKGEASELEVGSMIAGSIETLILSLASMEHRWSQMAKDKDAGVIIDENGSTISRAAVNAQLEALFKKDTISTEQTTYSQSMDDDNEDETDDLENEMTDRRTRYYQAFENAKNCDTQGYISQNIDPNTSSIRSLKDLTAISWAVFCTSTDSELELSEADEIQYNVFKMQALDNTNVLQRLNLGAAMLRMEKKRLKVKLSLAGKGNENSQDETA